jgi:hypothetical protein
VSAGPVSTAHWRTITGIDHFGFGRFDPNLPKLQIRPMIPPLSRRAAERLPSYLSNNCPYIIR